MLHISPHLKLHLTTFFFPRRIFQAFNLVRLYTFTISLARAHLENSWGDGRSENFQHEIGQRSKLGLLVLPKLGLDHLRTAYEWEGNLGEGRREKQDLLERIYSCV